MNIIFCHRPSHVVFSATPLHRHQTSSVVSKTKPLLVLKKEESMLQPLVSLSSVHRQEEGGVIAAKNGEEEFVWRTDKKRVAQPTHWGLERC
jgi:hypothetical protein